MGEGPDSCSAVGRPGARRTAGDPDWQRLFELDDPQAALEEVAGALAPHGDRELVLDRRGRGPAEGSCPVAGDPVWRVAARRLRGAPVALPALARRAARCLEAWRAARDALERAERRLEARAGELDLLQALVRDSAEARTPETLIRATAAALHRHAELDVVLVVRDSPPGGRRAAVYPARPVADADLQRMAELACETLEGSADAPARLEVHRLDLFDGQPGPRRALLEAEVVCLPLSRRGHRVACLAVLPAAPPGEGLRRILYGAANQLSLNLDRILTVREAERGRFRSTLDSMPQAVFLTDRELRVVQANRAAEELRGELELPPRGGRLLRVGDFELVSPAADVVGGAASTAEGEARTDGDRLWNVTVSAVGAADDPEALVVVLADVTERRRLLGRVAQSEKMSSLGQMISGIAHELNNPLASIVGYAQLLRAAGAEDKLAERLAVLDEQAHRCQKIVRNLLSFARGHEPEQQPLSLNDAVGTVVSLMSYQLRVDDIEIGSELDGDLPPVLGDAHQLQQALVNLVTNAQHAIRETGRPGKIRLRTRRMGERRVALEIEDDGPGIPPRLHSRIFDPFFSTKETGEGTGLGLSLVYGIVASHGGELHVDSDEGRGATFRIELPLPSSSARRPAEAGREAPAPPSRPGRILVVDDEVSIARMICEALAADGHQVCPVSSGREALDRLEHESFDLIVSDLKMPVMGGRQLYEEIRRQRPELSRRMVLTTGDTVSREPDDLARRGRMRVLHKPFDLDDLRRTVRTKLAGPKDP